MRVCQVIESSSGGSVQVALDLSRGLAAQGDHVTFVYSPLRADAIFEEQRTSLAAIRFIPVAMYRSLCLADIGSLWRLWRVLRKAGPFDVIHAHSSKAGGLVRLLRPFLPRKTVLLYSPHAFVTMAPGASRLFGVIERLLSFWSDKIVAVSSGEQAHAVKALKIAPDRVCVIPNGIDFPDPVARDVARTSLTLGPDDLAVGFVGRFVAQKNVKRLIDAFALAARQIPSLRLVMVGGGEGQDEIMAHLRASGVEARTILRLDQKARPVIPAFDVLCCSSDYEGISLVFLEALTAGVPIVTTPVAGAVETVRDGQTGFVATDFEATSLAACLSRWAALPVSARAQMGQAARLLSEVFTLDRMVVSYRDLYRQLIDKRVTG